MTQPIELIIEQLNDDDRLEALIPTERDGDDLYVLTVRVQDSTRDTADRVVHLRTAVVDTEEERAEWTDNGMWLPVTSNLPLELGKALVSTHNLLEDGEERDVPLIASGFDGGDDDLARRVLGVATETEPASNGSASGPTDKSPGMEGYWSELANDEDDGGTTTKSGRGGIGAGVDSETIRTCDDCGAERPESDMMIADLGGVEYATCRGPCDEEEDDE